MLFPIACLSLMTWVAGCSSDQPTHDVASMGAAPTQPPGGNPYAPGTALAKDMSPEAEQAFITKLGTLSPADRAAFIRDNSTTMTAIEAGSDSALKEKLADALRNK